MIQITKAPPYLTVQDLGRRGFRHIGVPVAGAMDAWAVSFGNTLVGNPVTAAAFEWALGPGVMTFTERCTIALTGATVEATLSGSPVSNGEPVDAGAGDELTVHRFVSGRFLYVAISGGIDVPAVLGSRSTYLPASLGGFEGRLLRTGDVTRHGETVTRRITPAKMNVAPDYSSETVRTIENPEMHTTVQWFFGKRFTVSAASDRTGYRFDGQPMAARVESRISTGVCPGTIQLPPSGLPIVLLSDAPTVGGYPILAVVCSVDLPIVAQRVPGAKLRFEPISIDKAQQLARQRANALQ